MAVGFGAKCFKGLLITFNFIFWLSGCTLLGLGLWILFDPHKIALLNVVNIEGHEPMMEYLAYGLLGVGGFILLVGIIGCCGALQESKCLLVLYFITLFLVFGAELSIGILAFLHKTQLTGKLENGIVKKIKQDYGMQDKEAFTQAVEYIQFKFNCCAYLGPDDYMESAWYLRNQAQAIKYNVSMTCCKLNITESGTWQDFKPINEIYCQSREMDKNKNTRHQIGCKDAIHDLFVNESILLIAVGCGIAVLELIGMVLAICLCRSLGEGGEA